MCYYSDPSESKNRHWGKPVRAKQGTERTLLLKQATSTHVTDPETIQLLPVQLSLKSAKQPHSPAKKTPS